MGASSPTRPYVVPVDAAKIRNLVAIVQKDPAVETVIGFSGGGAGTTTNTGRVFISLKPIQERKVTADQIINRLRPKLSSVAGATLVLQAVQDVRIGGRASAAQYQYTIQSDNLAELNEWGPKLLKTMRGIHQLTDVTSDAQNNGLAANLVIDRPTASRLGTHADAIDNVRSTTRSGSENRHDVHAHQPVLRGDGGGPGFLAKPRRRSRTTSM